MTGIPFIFSSQKDALALLEGPLGAYIKAALAKDNIYSFGHSWDNGFRQMVTATRPIQSPDDLKGLKVRTPPSPITVALFKAFGASPISISANEMYVALQTHLADGVEVPLSTIEVYKFYEVQKYVSYTNHMWTAFTILANGDAWRRLPSNLRDVAERDINAAGNLNNADFVKLMATLEAKLRGQGMVFNSPDTTAFRALVRRAGLYGQWKDAYGAQPWALLEASVGKLT
jgi:tripartite ATP-independent transporter DctP family solute receptor